MFCSLDCFFSSVLAAPFLADLTLTSTAGRSDRRRSDHTALRSEHSRFPGAKPQRGIAERANPYTVCHMISWHIKSGLGLREVSPCVLLRPTIISVIAGAWIYMQMTTSCACINLGSISAFIFFKFGRSKFAFAFTSIYRYGEVYIPLQILIRLRAKSPTKDDLVDMPTSINVKIEYLWKGIFF